MTLTQSAAIVTATHHPKGHSVPSVDEYREACTDLVGFHQRSIAAFAVALAPEWLGQVARFTAVLTGEC